MKFEYRSYPNKVIFASGACDRLPEFLGSGKRIMVIAGNRMKPRVDRLKTLLGVPLDDTSPDARIRVFSGIEQHVPQYLVDNAMAFMKQQRPDLLLCMGGGSAIGLAKALALETCLPIVAVPTTFSGSEQTNIWGIRSNEGKNTGKSDRVLPGLVIYDPDLVRGMPYELAFKSGMNAMAHLVEAMYAPDGNPVTRHHALLGMETMRNGLQAICRSKTAGNVIRPGHPDAKIPVTGRRKKTDGTSSSITTSHFDDYTASQLLFGAYLAGKCLGEVSMSLHHKTAHVLGGTFGLDHASVHTVLLPWVLAYQWPHLNAEIRSDFERILGNNPPAILKKLIDEGGVPGDLKSIGYNKKEIPGTVEIILSAPYANVAPLEKKRLISMLESAWAGRLTESIETGR